MTNREVALMLDDLSERAMRAACALKELQGGWHAKDVRTLIKHSAKYAREARGFEYLAEKSDGEAWERLLS